MKRLTRLLSLVLTIAMLMSLAAVPVQALDGGEVTGSISGTLRIDYAQTLSELKQREISVELLRDGAVLGKLPLTGAWSDRLQNTYPAQVGLR